MKKTTQNNGITLVALVITIIVLLILAMVTINILINEGIIGHANNAVRGYEVAEEKELIGLAYQNYKMDQLRDSNAQLTVDGANGGNPIAKEEGMWTIIFDKSRNKYELTEDGTVDVAKERWKDNGDGTISKGTVTVQIGDYINYDCGASETNKLTYWSFGANNGYTEYGSQAFEITNNPKWKILGVNGSGNILITTADPIQTKKGGDFCLQGRKGFVNGPDELDAISEIFGHGEHAEGARSITVEDINKITGYTPSTPSKYTYTKKVEDGKIYRNGETSSRVSSYAYYENNDIKGEWKQLASGETSPEISHTAYSYSIDNTNAAKKMLTKKDDASSDAEYFLATRSVSCSNDHASFDLFMVSTGSKVLLGSLYQSNQIASGVGYCSGGVRPVITLASDVSIEYDSTNNIWKIK